MHEPVAPRNPAHRVIDGMAETAKASPRPAVDRPLDVVADGRPTVETVFRPDGFFPGQFSGSGVLVSRFGSLLRKFTLTGVGVVDATTGVLSLTEVYSFDDGQVDRLEWSIRPIDDTRYVGSERSLIGPARGDVSANEFTWVYRRRVPDKSGDVRNMTFHDTFWRQADGSAVARASIRWMGIELSTMSVFYVKQST